MWMLNRISTENYLILRTVCLIAFHQITTWPCVSNQKEVCFKKTVRIMQMCTDNMTWVLVSQCTNKCWTMNGCSVKIVWVLLCVENVKPVKFMYSGTTRSVVGVRESCKQLHFEFNEIKHIYQAICSCIAALG